MSFNGVKVFSATMLADRDRLGERVTKWISDQIAAIPKCLPNCDNDPCSCGNYESFFVVDIVVTQSSDEAFHMVAITVFYNQPLATKGKR